MILKHAVRSNEVIILEISIHKSNRVRIPPAESGGKGNAMSLAQSQLHSSIDEYLQREREAAERHEWLDGLIYAMAGESAQHSLICANITIALKIQLRGTQ